MEDFLDKQLIADRIKALRKKNNISQEKMAELLKITYSTYSKIENAYQNITIKHLIGICKILNVSSDTILFGTTEKFPSLSFNDYIEYSNIFDDEELIKAKANIEKILEIKKIAELN